MNANPRQLLTGCYEPPRKRSPPAFMLNDDNDIPIEPKHYGDRHKLQKLTHGYANNAFVDFGLESTCGYSRDPLYDEALDGYLSKSALTSAKGSPGYSSCEDATTEVSKPKSDDIQCFGMIIEVDPSVRLDVLGDFVESRIEVALKISSQCVTVRHHDTTAYGGLLHQNLAWPLIEISKQPSVSFVAFVSNAPETGDDSRLVHPHRLCINVYGSEQVSGTIATMLDAAGIYLQHPYSSDLGVPYSNPHILVRPGGNHPAPSLEQHPSINGLVNDGREGDR
ncbi:MAG: hypothetical protein Q9214_000815 [Letrouitia sp. 1 TL-2023]